MGQHTNKSGGGMVGKMLDKKGDAFRWAVFIERDM